MTHLTDNLIKAIEERYDNIAGLIVMKEGEGIFEFYNQGFDHNHSIHVTSVTKSIVSALTGIALDKGAIKSIDQKVLEFFPDYRKKRGERTIDNITIRNLLTMTAPYKFKSEPYGKIYSSGDWTEAALDLLGGKGRIGDFKYTSAGLQVLAGILANATGRSLRDFAEENLFSPLGIEAPCNREILNKEEYLSFVKNKHVSGWVVDPKGINTAGWGLALTTIDMAKIGQLYLNRGEWENKSVIPSEWVEESTRVHSYMGELPYGYLWWIVKEGERRCYAAIGDGGNIIYIDPERNAVVAISSRFKPRAEDRMELIREYVYPLLKD